MASLIKKIWIIVSIFNYLDPDPGSESGYANSGGGLGEKEPGAGSGQQDAGHGHLSGRRQCGHHLQLPPLSVPGKRDNTFFFGLPLKVFFV